MRLGGQPKVVNDFLGEVYLPLLNKLGVPPVGAFTLTFGPDVPTIYLLSPYASLAAFGTTQERITAELPRLTAPAAQAFLSPPPGQPAYQRIESQLLVAFDSFRKLELPAATAKKEPRIFELRVYENPGELGHAKKVDMFGPKMGEMAIFREDRAHPGDVRPLAGGPPPAQLQLHVDLSRSGRSRRGLEALPRGSRTGSSCGPRPATPTPRSWRTSPTSSSPPPPTPRSERARSDGFAWG